LYEKVVTLKTSVSYNVAVVIELSLVAVVLGVEIGVNDGGYYY
jgi:hypothetical protein